jgi:hypothetical protein
VAALGQTTTDDDDAWADEGAQNDGNGNSDDDDDDEGFAEPTTYMFERATAVAALGEVCLRTGRAILPFVPDVMAALNKALHDYHEEVRVQAVLSLGGALLKRIRGPPPRHGSHPSQQQRPCVRTTKCLTMTYPGRTSRYVGASSG